MRCLLTSKDAASNVCYDAPRRPTIKPYHVLGTCTEKEAWDLTHLRIYFHFSSFTISADFISLLLLLLRFIFIDTEMACVVVGWRYIPAAVGHSSNVEATTIRKYHNCVDSWRRTPYNTHTHTRARLESYASKSHIVYRDVFYFFFFISSSHFSCLRSDLATTTDGGGGGGGHDDETQRCREHKK